jgi:hypothetical protein
MNFPAVKAETPFVVQWVDGTDKLVGASDVLVYPPDLLKDSPINHRRTREFSRQPLIAPQTSPQEPPSAQVTDEKLDEGDLEITLTAEVHGRKLKIANCRCGATIYEGIRSHHRSTFFKTMDRLIEELKQGVAIKVNRALPIDPAPVDPKHNGDGGKPHLVTEKLPLIDEEMREELANILKIHQPPELNAI